jgi:hypothetical protein
MADGEKKQLVWLVTGTAHYAQAYIPKLDHPADNAPIATNPHLNTPIYTFI